MSGKKNYSCVELFAGAGGMALGLERAGFHPVLLNDSDLNACATLLENRPHWNVVGGDIQELDFSHLRGKVDLVSGGFPCQPFSSAGKQLGMKDKRGSLFLDIIRVVDQIRPSVFLMENVKGILTIKGDRSLSVMKGMLGNIGYRIVEQDIYNAVYYRVPQLRERLIIIGVRSDIERFDYHNPASDCTHCFNLSDALKAGELYDTDVPESGGYTYSDWKKKYLSLIPAGGNWKCLPIDKQKEYMMNSFYSKGGKTSMARRLSWHLPCPTLTCSPSQKMTERCHPDETRPLTIREYARIQTFPDTWKFVGSFQECYRQIGNAMPVNMAEAIGKAIIRAL